MNEHKDSKEFTYNELYKIVEDKMVELGTFYPDLVGFYEKEKRNQ